MVTKAVLAALVAFAVAAVLTPLAARFARRIGAVDDVKERGLAREATPLLGGLAIFGGALVAGLLFLPDNQRTEGILAGAALITIVGALDDVFDLHWLIKLAGQIAAAVVLVTSGVTVDAFTLPFVHRVELGDLGAPVTALGLVALMNVVNFSDGVDGLAAGVCAISAVAFSIIAFDLGRTTAGILAAIIGRRRARLPAVQLPPGVGVHGRLRVEPARAVARRGDRRGHAEDERVDRARRPAGRARRAVPGHRLRGRASGSSTGARRSAATPTTSTTASTAWAGRRGARCSTSTRGR